MILTNSLQFLISSVPQKFQTLKKAKRLKKSSQKWLLRQINDPFVERAQREGWRSRAAFKIIEIDEKFKIFKKGKIVVDLGAAPGGWSQYAVTKVGEGNVVAIDLLEIDSLPGVNFFVGDFMTEEAPQKIIAELAAIRNRRRNHNSADPKKFDEMTRSKETSSVSVLKHTCAAQSTQQQSQNSNLAGYADVVMSDMAANTTGDHNTDHMRIIALLEESLNLAEKILKPNGSFVGKIFQGGSSDEILKKLRANFSTVKYFKPDSSRKDSSETYLVALGFKKL